MFLYLLIGISSIFILRELYILKKLLFYKKQGLTIEYYPFIFKILIVLYNTTKRNDTLLLARQKFGVVKDEDFHVTNDFTSTKSLIHPLSQKAVKEFFSRELKFTKKLAGSSTSHFLGFFYGYGKPVEEGRALMSQIFRIENIKKLTPALIETVRRHCGKLEKIIEEKTKMREDDWIEMNFKEEIFVPMFEDLSTTVLFGARKRENVGKWEGKSVTFLVKNIFQNIIKYELNPLKLFTFGYGEKLGIIKEMKEANIYSNELEKLVKAEFKRRLSFNGNEKNPDNLNFLDLVVEEVKNGVKDISIKEVCSLINLFQFAAADTSFHGSSSALILLSSPENKSYQEELRNEDLFKLSKKSQIYTMEDVDQSKLLNNVFKEAFRMIPPAPVLTKRIITKDTQFCGYKVKKGDLIQIPVLGLGINQHIFPEPEKFNPQRHEIKVSKTQLLPFSHGARNCVGKVLGELLVKVIITEFLTRFEFEWKDGFQMKMGLDPLYGVTNGVVRIRKLKKNC